MAYLSSTQLLNFTHEGNQNFDTQLIILLIGVV